MAWFFKDCRVIATDIATECRDRNDGSVHESGIKKNY